MLFLTVKCFLLGDWFALPVANLQMQNGQQSQFKGSSIAVVTYAKIYIHLVTSCILDVFPFFVRIKYIERPMTWNKIQVSVKFKLKSLSERVEANLKIKRLD